MVEIKKRPKWCAWLIGFVFAFCFVEWAARPAVVEADSVEKISEPENLANKANFIACTNPRGSICPMVHIPVCARRDTGIRCVTTPCESHEMITKTNACVACSEQAVIGYTKGACMPEIAFLKQPTPNHWAAGQPTFEQFAQLPEAGIKTVINLRPQGEFIEFDEQQLVEKLGMAYHLIPVASAADLSLENVKKLDALLADNEGEKVFMHCASSNRLGALMALRAVWLQDEDIDSAIQTGKEYGLTKMEAVVRQIAK